MATDINDEDVLNDDDDDDDLFCLENPFTSKARDTALRNQIQYTRMTVRSMFVNTDPERGLYRQGVNEMIGLRKPALCSSMPLISFSMASKS